MPRETATPRSFDAESRLARVRRARRINRKLAHLYPDAHCELDYDSPLELLVATILSAQTTDIRVNQVTPELFAKYRSAVDYAGADRAELETILKPTGFFRSKANSLIKLGQVLCERFDGEVPRTLPELDSLPGVGRKTANVVLGNAFGVPGITVDTHFQRLARRFGWTVHTDPVKIEHETGAMFPPGEWTMLSHRMIFHGRRICHARRPACGACPLAPLCPSYGEGELDPDKARALLKSGKPRPPRRPPAGHLAALSGPPSCLPGWGRFSAWRGTAWMTGSLSKPETLLGVTPRLAVTP